MQYIYKEQNIDNIDWTAFSNNSSIFTYDYHKMKEIMMNGFYDELISKVLHPDRLMKISQKYNIEFIQLVQIFYD